MYAPGAGIVAAEDIAKHDASANCYASAALLGLGLATSQDRGRFASTRKALRIAARNAVTAFAGAAARARGAVIFDVGCGRGQDMPLYGEAFKGAAVVGVDSCLYALHVAATRATAAKVPATLMHGDMNNWEPPRAAANVVVFQFSAHYAESAAKIVHIADALLKPGGVAVITTMDGDRVTAKLEDGGGEWRSRDGYLTLREHGKGQVHVTVAGAVKDVPENLVFARELREAVEAAGLRATRVALPLADIGGADAGEAAEIYVAHVIEKEK